MIDIVRIDHWAANGKGMFHRASVPAKLLFVVLVVAAAVVARDPWPLGTSWLSLAGFSVICGLPWSFISALALYAAVFAALYAFSLHGALWFYALVLLKAVTPAYAVGMLIVSTPYPKIFAFLSGLLPELLAAGLFMTYRSFFILLDMMDKFAVAIRLRGGFSPGSIVRNGANVAKGIGALLVRAVERASRLHAVMVVRGYSGSMAETGRPGFGPSDWIPVMYGGGVLLLCVIWT